MEKSLIIMQKKVACGHYFFAVWYCLIVLIKQAQERSGTWQQHRYLWVGKYTEMWRW